MAHRPALAAFHQRVVRFAPAGPDAAAPYRLADALAATPEPVPA